MRQFSSTYLSKNHHQFTVKIFVVRYLWLDFRSNGLYLMFHRFSKLLREVSDIRKILREFYCGCTIKLLSTNCSFHTENNQTFVFRTDLFHSVRTLKLRSEYFAVWTSQLVNKSIVLKYHPLLVCHFVPVEQ